MIDKIFSLALVIYTFPAQADILDFCRSRLGLEKKAAPIVDLSFDMKTRYSDESRRAAIVNAASRGSHKPLFSVEQMELVGRDVATGEDFLFVIDNEQVQGLKIGSSKANWIPSSQLAEGAFVLEDNTLLRIEYERFDEDVGFRITRKALDFDAKKIVELINEKALALEGAKRLAVSANRSAILQLLLKGQMRLNDLSPENVLIGISSENMRQYVLIRKTDVAYAKIIPRSFVYIPILSSTSAGKPHDEFSHPTVSDRLNLEDGTHIVVNDGEDF